MYRKTVFAGLSSLWISTAVLADGAAIPSNSGTVVISTAVDASCFAEAAAQALVSGQANWWQPLGYKSAAEWFAAALSYAVAGISADAKFDVTGLNSAGTEQLDFKANIDGATLVLAATTTRNSASRFARTWREDWVYSPQYAGVTWVSGKAQAGRRAVGGSFGEGASGMGASVDNVISIIGQGIHEFRNHLVFNAKGWSLAGSESYAGLFDRAASAMGKRISPVVAAVSGRALANAVANTVLLADVNVHYKAQQGEVVIDDTKVSLACGAGTVATAEGFAAAN